MDEQMKKILKKVLEVLKLQKELSYIDSNSNMEDSVQASFSLGEGRGTEYASDLLSNVMVLMDGENGYAASMAFLDGCVAPLKMTINAHKEEGV